MKATIQSDPRTGAAQRAGLLSMSAALLQVVIGQDADAEAWFKAQIASNAVVATNLDTPAEADSSAASVYQVMKILGIPETDRLLLGNVSKENLPFWLKLCEILSGHSAVDGGSISSDDIQTFLKPTVTSVCQHYRFPSYNASSWGQQRQNPTYQYRPLNAPEPQIIVNSDAPHLLQLARLVRLCKRINDPSPIIDLVGRYQPKSRSGVLATAEPLLKCLVNIFSQLAISLDAEPARESIRSVLLVSTLVCFGRVPKGPYNLSMSAVPFLTDPSLNHFLGDRLRHQFSLRAHLPKKDAPQMALKTHISAKSVTVVKDNSPSGHMLQVRKQVRADATRLPFDGTRSDATSWQQAKCSIVACQQCATFTEMLSYLDAKDKIKTLAKGVGGMTVVENLLADRPDVLYMIRKGRPAPQAAGKHFQFCRRQRAHCRQ